MKFSIAQAAHHSGLSVDTLRNCERIELADRPNRDAAGRRVYSHANLVWLRFVTRLRRTGMSIQKMRKYAALRRQRQTTAGPRKRMLVEHRDSMVERIAELQACLDVLDHKIDSYERIERNMIAESPDAARVDATPTEKEVSA